MKEQKVYVAIVTYNRKEYLLNLLEALQQSEKRYQEFCCWIIKVQMEPIRH